MASEQSERCGQRIRAAREAKEWSQSRLAREMPGKVDGPSISRWELGKVMPGEENLSALAAALDKDIAYFLIPEPKSGTPDLMGALNGDDDEPGQLDRIEAQLADVLDQLAALKDGQDALRTTLGVRALGRAKKTADEATQTPSADPQSKDRAD